MSTAAHAHWQEANQRYLMAALGPIRDALERQAGSRPDEEGAGSSPEALRSALQEAATALPAPAALQMLTTRFGLSAFERDVLLLCAGVELDAKLAATCRAANGGGSVRPCFAHAMAAFDDAHWSALTPASPLRRWRLVEPEEGATIATSPLRIDERVLHFLAGVGSEDERLAGILVREPPPHELPPSHRAVVELVVDAWRRAGDGRLGAVVELCGAPAVGRRAIAAAAADALGLGLRAVHWAEVPTVGEERHLFARLLEREAVMSESAILVDCDDLEGASQRRAVRSLLDDVQGMFAVATREPLARGRHASVRIDVTMPSTTEQRSSWCAALGPVGEERADEIDQIVAQFRLGARDIGAVSASFIASTSKGPCSPAEPSLWDLCRQRARGGLDELAQRIEPAARWDDLVLPDPQKGILRDVAAHVRQRTTVYEKWGFAAKGERGLGISALFAGASGTGKTMAAEVLANELGLDLWRIDLAQVVSKYIGETEKNLRKVFDAADVGGTILLFDEADALFGKRSEVKDSHDRYANIEISYLLQRMETYRGLAILTTNMKNALDQAFLRRIRFVVQFPFPDARMRAEIWQRIFPPETPTRDLDPETLARLNVTGGSIRNIALGAAFVAAEVGESVTMAHLQRAARGEYAKLEKPVTDSELGGWS